ncbi:SpoIIIAH-like family protein [Lutibacter sp. B2]|nr:SpoIIIAH-like family protein [Lutibacter sp. B2]
MFNLKMKRKNIFIISLICILCCISYLNYAVNKYSSLDTSSGFKEYEENALTEKMKEDQNITKDQDNETQSINSDEDKKDLVVVDSNESQIDGLVAQTSKNIENTMTNTKSSSFFIEARLNMNMEREKMIVLLNEIINNSNTDQKNIVSANDEKMKLIDIMNKEKIVENLIKSKGFEDTVVFITDYSVNVIVETEQFTDPDMAKIFDIVMRETKVPVDNIKISNKF